MAGLRGCRILLKSTLGSQDPLGDSSIFALGRKFPRFANISHRLLFNFTLSQVNRWPLYMP
jgi:hypothetical protein